MGRAARADLPDGIPMPRAGIGAVAIPPLVVLERIGLFPGASAWIDAAVDQLRRRRDQLVADGNPAERWPAASAARCRSSTAAAGSGAVAALRWKTQFNENAKVPGVRQRVPELCHNEICGWGQHGDVTRQVFTRGEPAPRLRAPAGRRGASSCVDAVLDEVVAGIDEVVAEGEGRSPSCSTWCSSATS